MTATSDAQVLRELDDRGITEARHFTTSHGLLGVLSAGRLLSRSDLQDEDELKHIAINNWDRRWDKNHLGDVSLSLQRINGYLYGISRRRWRVRDKDVWWAVLGFDREVLAHPGVEFVTTNNGYSVAQRAKGLAGLLALFADQVVTWEDGGPRTIQRTALTPAQTTCPQAEALYPEGVSTAWLRTIYVPEPELADTVQGWFRATEHRPIDVLFDPEVFA